MSRGIFIVLDGIDGSGKGTQLEILKTKLEDEGYDVETFDFPRYGEKSAGLVEEYLNGKYGTADEVGPFVGSIFYAVDRYAASKEIKKAIDDGKVVISNRYVSASKGHQASKIDSQEGRKDFISWLNNLEYKIFNIPIPDITFFIHVPATISYDLVLKKKARGYLNGKKQDIHEADRNHLQRTEAAYLEMANGADDFENWVIIDCCKDSKLLSIDEVSKLIYQSLTDQKIL